MMMLFRSVFTVMFLQPMDLQLGSHFIIIGVNFIAYTFIYMYVNDFGCVTTF